MRNLEEHDSSYMTVMSMDSFHSSSGWRFENGNDGGGGPKLEDFLGGGCYCITAKEDEGGGRGGGINVNISPNSLYHEYHHTDDDIVESRDTYDCYFSPPPPAPPPPQPSPPCLLYYGYRYYTSLTNTANQIPQQDYLIPTTTNNIAPYNGAITPISEFKSWLRQPAIPPPPPPQPPSSSPDCEDQHVNNSTYQECVSLGVTTPNSVTPMPTNSSAADNRKRGVAQSSTKTVTKNSSN